MSAASSAMILFVLLLVVQRGCSTDAPSAAEPRKLQSVFDTFSCTDLKPSSAEIAAGKFASVYIVRAEKLPIYSGQGLSSRGIPDGYVSLQIAAATGTQTASTQVVKDQLGPDWDFHCVFLLPTNAKLAIVGQVMDWNGGGQATKIGDIRGEVEFNQNKNFNMNLENCNLCTTATAYVTASISWSDTMPNKSTTNDYVSNRWQLRTWIMIIVIVVLIIVVASVGGAMMAKSDRQDKMNNDPRNVGLRGSQMPNQGMGGMQMRQSYQQGAPGYPGPPGSYPGSGGPPGSYPGSGQQQYYQNQGMQPMGQGPPPGPYGGALSGNAYRY